MPSNRSDLVRAGAVALTAVTQVISAPVTMALLGPSADNGAISDANQTPLTPADYAFSIWGLIYAACLALAVYQLLPGQRGRAVHRRTGWWLVAERLLLRLPVTLYLGWATLASVAGFGVTFRSLGMPERAGWVTGLCVALLVAVGVVAALVVSRETAAAGFAFTACWALVAVSVATDAVAVRWVSLAIVAAVLAVLGVRAVQSRRATTVLLG